MAATLCFFGHAASTASGEDAWLFLGGLSLSPPAPPRASLDREGPRPFSGEGVRLGLGLSSGWGHLTEEESDQSFDGWETSSGWIKRYCSQNHISTGHSFRFN
jgi:hypothetical protein